jgi:SAM-dependent methyltransferase
MTRSVQEWAAHWNARAVIEDPVARCGYCVDGVPIDAGLYRAAVIEPWLKRLELEAGHHVLDVGCGSGLLLREIEARVKRAVGTDISEAMVRRSAGSAETYVCAAHELPFEGEQFDRIVMASVCHYFPSLDYFREVAVKLVSVLRTPGLLLIGDIPLGAQPPATPYLYYEAADILGLFELLAVRVSIEPQSELKRSINSRHDVLVRKGAGR